MAVVWNNAPLEYVLCLAETVGQAASDVLPISFVVRAEGNLARQTGHFNCA